MENSLATAIKTIELAEKKLDMKNIQSAFEVCAYKKDYQNALDAMSEEEQIQMFFPGSEVIRVGSEFAYLVKLDTNTAVMAVYSSWSNSKIQGLSFKFTIIEFADFIEIVLEHVSSQDIDESDVDIDREDYMTEEEFKEDLHAERWNIAMNNRYQEAFSDLSTQCKESEIKYIIDFHCYDIGNETAGTGLAIESEKFYKKHKEYFENITFVSHLKVPVLQKNAFWKALEIEIREQNKK